MSNTKEITLFAAAELSAAARERAYSNWLECALDYDWYECVISDATEIGKLLGIEDMVINFSGFSSQGDGACFTGRYNYAKNAPANVANYAPLDAELTRIAKMLQDAQRSSFYQLAATITHAGRYCHENSVSVQVIDTQNHWADISDATEGKIAEPLRDFMRWIYAQLEKDHDFLTSEQSFLQAAEANGYEYTADGKQF